MLLKKEIKAHLFSEEKTEEVECLIWNSNFRGFVKTNFLITFNKSLEITYKTTDGQILGTDQIQDLSKNPEIKINLQKIQFLRWFGQYGQSNQKIGRWSARWRGQTLNDVGGQYSEFGQKQGLWKELIQNYWNNAQVYEVGQYLDDQKIGIWKSIFEDKEIGSGQFNEQSFKVGNWIEVSDNFWELSQLTYHGEYKNGKKIGRWDIYLRIKGYDQPLEYIGGGSYDEYGGCFKIGKWIEHSDEFYEDNQVTYIGEYKNGIKIGRWNTYLKFDGGNEQIGGGSYDCQENGLKFGRWIELGRGFYERHQAIFDGEYQNGIKVGRWNYYLKFNGKNEKIGGGLYEESGNKIGKWIELSEGSCRSRYIQVIYSGEYNNNSLKIGEWNTYFRDRGFSENFKKIGGGQYDVNLASVKKGKWIELSENFGDGLGQSLISYIGEYTNGKRFGLWDIYWGVDLNKKKSEWLGGGLYNGFGRKMGKWVEVNNLFFSWKQVKYSGEYNDGKKIKKWYNLWRQKGENQKFEQIGYGSYDDQGEGQKTGQWIELSEDFYDKNQIIYDGLYKNGIKVGIWYELERFVRIIQAGFRKTGELVYEE